MASEQVMSDAIARAVVEATRVVLQTMREAMVQGTWNTAGPKLGSPTLKKPLLNWETPD